MESEECIYCAYGLCAIHLNTLGDADDCYPNPEYCPDFTPKKITNER